MMRFGDAVMQQGAAPPPQARIGQQQHFLAYITAEEARQLRRSGGGVAPDGGQLYGPAGVPAFADGPGGSGDGQGQAGGDPGAQGSDDGPSDSSGDVGGGEPLPPAAPKEDPAEVAAKAAAAAEKARQEKLTADRSAAAGQLQAGFGERFGDALYSGRRQSFMDAYTPQIERDRVAARGATIAGMDPELQATPVAWSLANGVDEQAQTATAGLGDAWAAEETRLRSAAKTGLDESLKRLNSADDPMSVLNAETQAQLALFQSQQGGANPNYSYSLAPAGNAGVNAYANSRVDEQLQQERLSRLLSSLPRNAASSVVR